MSKFKKTKAQKEATNILSSSARHIALSGGSRSGKSFLFMYAVIVRACKYRSRHCIFRLNFNHIKRSIVMDTLPKVMDLAFPNLKYNFNKTDYFMQFPNGSQIFFAGLDSGERVEKVLGQEFSTLWFNEISQIPYSSVQMALTRLAEKNGLKKKVYYDMNPSTKTHWSYPLFIKKLNPIDREPLKNPDNYKYFQMNPIDNLENLDEEYIELLESLPEKERLRFLKGEFNDESDGQVYYEFRRDDHVTPTAIQMPGSLFIGMDFNVNPMTAVIASIVNDEIHIFDECFLENSDTPKMAAELDKRNYIGQVIPDSTAKRRQTSGLSDFKILEDSGQKIVPTKNPFVTDRVNNINRLLKDNRIKINPKCRKLINDLEMVSWKNNDLDQKTDPMLTHISDALGYLAWNLFPIVPNRKPQKTIIL